MKDNHPKPERDEEIEALFDGFKLARSEIIKDLERRSIEGDPTVKLIEHSQSNYDDDGPTNYVVGAGVIQCPVCKAAVIRYARSAYNGHIHAACMSGTCVQWME